MSDNVLIDFVGSVIGGIISGIAGIFVARYTIIKQNKEAIRENTYIPLYEKIMSLKIEPFFHDYAEPMWSGLPNHQRLKVNNYVRVLFQEYEKIANEYNVLRSVDDNRIYNNAHNFVESIQPIFDNLGLIVNDRIPIHPIFDTDVEKWIIDYRFVLFDKQTVEPNSLFNNLREYSVKRELRHEKWYDVVKEKTPVFYDRLLEKLKEIISTSQSNAYSIDFKEKSSKLKENILKLEEELHKQVRN